MQLQTREKNMLGVLLIILIGAALWNFALSTVWNRYLEASGSVRSLSAKLADAKENLAGLISLRRDQGALQDVLSKVDSNEKGDPGTLAIRRLQGAVHGLDVHLLEIKPAVVKKIGSFATLTVSVRGNGKYHSFMQFLQRLHTDLPAYEVTRVQVNPSTEQAEWVEFSLSIVARHYEPTGGTKK